ncbi:MAG: hypothetical protein ABIA37_03075 [Candidatus Woesearchaeota archaeon]
MKVPKSFRAELDRRECQEKKKRLTEIELERKIKEQHKKFREKEFLKINEKIEICKKIFSWREEFLKTKEGMTLFNRSGKELWVFSGTWANQRKRYGCWSRIYFTDKAIDYWQGYKWMGGGKVFTFSKPELMAEKLDYVYLKEFLKEVEDKSIFKSILEFNH